MDLSWTGTEPKPGQYDFSPYDRLLAQLEARGLRAIFILDYGNPLYDQGLAPFSDEGRSAFVRWAVAAARHFCGKGILWEIWNEPNSGDFWRPRANVDRYIALATAVGEAFRQNGLNETLIGPAAQKFPYRFLKKCMEAGLWKYWSGVSLHPYRGSRPPETVSVEYRRLNNLLGRYAANTDPSILSGEWGYSTAQRGIGEAEQAKYLARMWLHNLADQIPISIWYDWQDDGTDPKNPEHHFGMVRRDFQPKPAFEAAKTLNSLLGGYQLDRRLSSKAHRGYGVLFRKGESLAWALWTTSPKHQCTELEVPPGSYRLWDYLGRELERPSLKNGRIALELSDAPQYLIQE